MFSIRTLEEANIAEITAVFNASFSDYFVPLQLTRDQMEAKFKGDNIALKYSVGAYHADQLVGFILHFYKLEDGSAQIYNGGTGVIPTYRGQGLTQRMYAYILPKLASEQIDSITLEVLTQNIQALKSYKKIGFQEVRTLLCFKGEPLINNTNTEVVLERLEEYHWTVLTTFWSILPTWQNSIATITNLGSAVLALGAYLDKKLVGYIIFNKSANRIMQIAVAENYRNIGIGKRMVQAVTEDTALPIAIINVDDAHPETAIFFEKMGLSNYANQIELKK